MKKLIIILTAMTLLMGLALELQAQTRGSREVSKTDNSKSILIEKEELTKPARAAASKTRDVKATKSDDGRTSQSAVKQTTKQEEQPSYRNDETRTQSSSRSTSSTTVNRSSKTTSSTPSRSSTTPSRTSQSTSRSRTSSSYSTDRNDRQSDSGRSETNSRQNSFDDDYYNYSSPRVKQPEQTRSTTSSTSRTTLPAKDKTVQKETNENTRSNPVTNKDTVEKEKNTASQTQKEKQDRETVYKVFTPETKVKEQTGKSVAEQKPAVKSAQPLDGKDRVNENRQLPPSAAEDLYVPGRDGRPPHTGDGDHYHGDGDNNHGGGHGDGNHGGGHGDNHHNNHGWTGYHNNHGWNWRPPRDWYWNNYYNNWYWQNPYYHVTWYNHPWNWYNPHFSWNWYFAYHNFGYVSYVHYYDWYPSHHWIVYPSFSHYYSWTNRIHEFTGYLIIDDLDTIYPYSYGMVTRKPNGDYETFYFDRYGNRLARRLIDRYGHLNKKIYVEVRGYVDYSEQTIRVTSMRKVNWHRNVYLSFYYHPRWFRLGFWHWG